MTEEQKILIDDAFTQLPPAIQWAAEDTAWDYVCPQITARYDLTEIQSGNLTVEVGLYISGIIEMKEFVTELNIITNENDELNKNIMRDLLTEIFEPFLNNIKENKSEIHAKISDMHSEIEQLNSEIREDANESDGIPMKTNLLYSIPIKKKISYDPVMVTKTVEEFSNIQKPSAYISKNDPYHEDF